MCMLHWQVFHCCQVYVVSRRRAGDGDIKLLSYSMNCSEAAVTARLFENIK